MKIYKKYIIEICNWEHPDFGTFAKFLSGLGKGQDYFETYQPEEASLCDICYRPLWGTVCLYCKGKHDALKENPVSDCEHTWTAEGKIRCIKCGIYQDFLKQT